MEHTGTTLALVTAALRECVLALRSLLTPPPLSHNALVCAAEVTALEFVGTTHLLTGGADNTICIWRCADWLCLHKLGGHKGPIHSIAAHPSGRIALSTAQDRTLRLWDLVKGRMSFINRLASDGMKVLWSPAADTYVTRSSQVPPAVAPLPSSRVVFDCRW